MLVTAPVICMICDNPRASEITNNLGPGSRMFCRICMVSFLNTVQSALCLVCHSG